MFMDQKIIDWGVDQIMKLFPPERNGTNRKYVKRILELVQLNAFIPTDEVEIFLGAEPLEASK